MSVMSRSREVVNTALRPLNVQVIKARSDDPSIQGFISARRTVAAARASGLSVGDYVDATFSEPGATARAVEAMLGMSGLSSAARVCEIGPGTGRYAEKVVAALHPDVYEIYETATDWLPHLRTLPHALVQPCDGHTLRATADDSVDLVHANKVFVYIPFPAVVGYLDEMVRVARPGGTIAFDVVTEPCLTDEVVHTWVREGSIFRPVPRDWLIDYLKRRGAALSGSHLGRLVDSRSELFAFRKVGDPAARGRVAEAVRPQVR